MQNLFSFKQELHRWAVRHVALVFFRRTKQMKRVESRIRFRENVLAMSSTWSLQDEVHRNATLVGEVAEKFQFIDNNWKQEKQENKFILTSRQKPAQGLLSLPRTVCPVDFYISMCNIYSIFDKPYKSPGKCCAKRFVFFVQILSVIICGSWCSYIFSQ